MKVLLCLVSKDQTLANQQIVLNYGSESNKQSLSVRTNAQGYFDLDDALIKRLLDVTATLKRKTYPVHLIKIDHEVLLTLLDKQNKLAMKPPLSRGGMFGEKRMRQDDPPKLKEHVDVIECARRGMYDPLLELIEKYNADVNEQNENGDYAIVCAAQRNDLKMVKMLFEHGARLDVQDSVGRTALGYAKKYDNSELIAFITETLAKNSHQSDIGMELQ